MDDFLSELYRKSIVILYTIPAMLSRNHGHNKIHSSLRDNRISMNKHSRRGKTSITKILNLWKIELEEVTRIWKGLLYTLIGKINIMKNGHSTKSSLQIQCNLNKKNSMPLFTETEKKILKFMGNSKRPQKAKAILSKRTKLEGFLFQISRHKNSVVLAWKETCRPMEQYSIIKHEHTYLQPSNI